MSRMTAAAKFPSITSHAEVKTGARVENGVLVGLDDERAAHLGKMAELPNLGECLAAWMDRYTRDACMDHEVEFRTLALTPDSKLAFTELDAPQADRMDMTYRTFGNVQRGWCNPPRNVARNLIRLRCASTIYAENVLTIMRSAHSARACAYNDLLAQRNEQEARRLNIPGQLPERIVLRSRALPVMERKGDEMVQVGCTRTIIAPVSLTHCLRDGDDDKMILALMGAFAGEFQSARATAYRGVEESELRAIFPGMEVKLPGAGSEMWSGYLVARNSESGCKSWSISAGLYRSQDGVSVACEAIVRHGRHVGSHVAERMVEVADGAREMLAELAKKAAELAGKLCPWSLEEFWKKLTRSLAGTVLSNEDSLWRIALTLGEIAQQRGFTKFTIGELINALGVEAATFGRRVERRPVEVMLGRMLVNGWSELKAVGSDSEDDAAEE